MMTEDLAGEHEALERIIRCWNSPSHGATVPFGCRNDLHQMFRHEKSPVICFGGICRQFARRDFNSLNKHLLSFGARPGSGLV